MSTHQSQSRCRRAFTLVELMISIAIVLVLMLGINFVFSMSSRTVSTGMALSNVGRDIRNARKTLETDFGNAVTAEEMPALIIHSNWIYAWRDAQDKLADYDSDPSTYDVNAEQSDGDEIVLQSGAVANLPGLYNNRRHRIDRISFFAHHNTDDYRRQTGDSSTYIGPETSPEAWISFGPLRLAANDSVTYWKPGARGVGSPAGFPDEKANQNNFFATQWILGRNVILLKDANYFGGTPALGNIFRFRGAVPMFCRTEATNTSNNAMPHETPPYATAAPGWHIQESRLDLAAATIASMRALPGFGQGSAVTWWEDGDATTSSAARDFLDYNTCSTGSTAQPTTTLNYLFWAKPFVNKQSFEDPNPAQRTAAQTRETALTTPIFMRGVSQFIVEFAGDFYDQGPDATGVPEPVGAVGTDYDVLPGPIPTRRTHWYGLPRDADGDGVCEVRPISVPPTSPTPPARRWGPVGAPAPPTNGQPPFEHDEAGSAIQMTSLSVRTATWAWGTTTENKPEVGEQGVQSPAWPAPTLVGYGTPGDIYNVRPTYIRITIELLDANGRLQEGQRIEFVYSLK